MSIGLPVGPPVAGGDARPPQRRTLEGRFVRLEPLDPGSHSASLWRAVHDGSSEAVAMWVYMPYGPFADEGEMHAWVNACARSNDPLFLVVVSWRVGPVGVASFLNVDTAMRHLELGHIWYSPSAQRTEANTEAAYLMLREAFDVLGHRRVEWKCDALNERSREAALRLGFTFEGVFRNHMIVKGRNRDSAWFAVTDDEWPSVAAALRRWLDADPGSRPPLATIRHDLRERT